jgi:site-specific DNA recombinase
LLENAVWREICKLLNDPRSLQQEDQSAEAARQSPEIERHRAQLLKLQHGLGRLIDSYTEGMVEKDQFTSRMKQTKARIAEIEGRLSATSEHIDRQQQLQLLSSRLAELSAHLGLHIENAEWSSRREVIRAIVQRIEINPTAVTIVPRFSAATPISIGRTALSARLPQALS